MEDKNKLIWKTKDLKSWSKNPRTIKRSELDRLKAQIKELGQYKPLIITPEGEVLGGNMRLKAYLELGWRHVWVSIVTPKDEAEKIKYALSDNDRAGEYDEGKLFNLAQEYGAKINLDSFKVDLNKSSTLKDLLNNFKPGPITAATVDEDDDEDEDYDDESDEGTTPEPTKPATESAGPVEKRTMTTCPECGHEYEYARYNK